jgi:hypothetical protein
MGGVAAGRERGVGDCGDLRVGDPGLVGVVPDGAGVADRGPGILADPGDSMVDLLVGAGGDGEAGASPPAGHDERPGVVGGVGADDQRAGRAGLTCGGDGLGDEHIGRE